MGKNCPLCAGNVDEDMYHFVKYVTSNQENMQAYIDGELTYSSWRTMMIKALGLEKKGNE